jgi:hypothetical protein
MEVPHTACMEPSSLAVKSNSHDDGETAGDKEVNSLEQSPRPVLSFGPDSVDDRFFNIALVVAIGEWNVRFVLLEQHRGFDFGREKLLKTQTPRGEME